MNVLPRWLLLALFALLIVAPSESFFFASSSFGARCGQSARPSCRALLAPLSSLTRRCARADLMVPVCAEDTGDEVSPLAQPHTHLAAPRRWLAPRMGADALAAGPG